MNNLIVYIDIYYLTNFLTDVILLCMLAIPDRSPITLWRILIAGNVGALSACLNLVCNLPVLLRILLFLVLPDLIMVWIIRPQVTGARRLWLACQLYGISLLAGGCYQFLKDQMGSGNKLPVALLAMTAAVLLLEGFLRERREQRNLYSICVCLNGREVETKALLDTGNSLHEPISGRPVLVLEQRILQKILEKDVLEYTTRIRMIPYHSVGEDHGLLTGIVTDRVIIKKHPRKIINDRAVVALYQGTLSAGGRYHGLLQEEFLEGETTNAF